MISRSPHTTVRRVPAPTPHLTNSTRMKGYFHPVKFQIVLMAYSTWISPLFPILVLPECGRGCGYWL
ncbi:hypothetical protein BDZ91DRAFT_736130 [Kalaharituber pfeilii]|nr:hypothetical protein BDZ91DRAFT_736130 [Kalaharituber pfeilii]